ncbi:MAG: matrixin family metalloprotease [Bryobacteraceae bacterium]|nr:matrixin family metalloprotease [Bryobacteraceae bacterium]MDW8377924.1 matrixin family metalloprotease [Bryobacterales bacterium]
MMLKKHVLVLLCAGVGLCPSAWGYYHFVRYLSRTAPFVAAPEKFDLNALPNRTLNFYVSEVGPTGYVAGDSFASVVSQIRQAAKVWTDVPTSDLQLNFGGLLPPGTSSSGPAIDVVFSDDIPPGLLALGGPTSRGEIVGQGPGSPFYPITRSVVILRRNLADLPADSRASFLDGFFLTLAHEFGHAIGLQHTLTSSLMSTSITRGVTKAKPLSADDVAGVSLLYPAPTFLASTGSISGRVTMAGVGVNLASVVAIPPSGAAISTLTHPDGTYRIDGIPPGQYHLYVHPLPPAGLDEASPANIVLPLGPDQRPFPLSPSFETQFYPGTRDPVVAVPVMAGSTLENLNFQVVRRNAPAIWNVQSYGFIGQNVIRPPMLSRASGRGLVVATGVGLMANPTTLTPGLSVTPIGGSAALVSGSLRPYSPSYLQMEFSLNPFSSEGPQHLVFSANNDIYVLPSAFHITLKGPPSIASAANTVDASGARVVALTGSNLGPDTRIFFDGHPAAIRSVDEQAGRMIVVPPPAPPGHRAAIVALNADGQTSGFAQGPNVTTYSYDAGEPASLSLSPNALPAGSEGMVEIQVPGANLIDGLAKLGFGTSEVTVRRVWVVSPTRLIANVMVSPTANGPTSVSVVNGLQLIHQSAAFVALPSNPRLIHVFPQALNPTTGQAFVQAGSPAMVLVHNLPAGTSAASVTLTLNDVPIPVTALNGNQLLFQIPSGFPSGPATLRIRVGAESSQPVAIAIEQPPPVILAIQNGGQPVDASRPARPGDWVTLLVAGLIPDAFSGQVEVSRLSISVGGVTHPVHSVQPAASPGQLQVVFLLTSAVPSGLQPLSLSQDGRVSLAASLPVQR